MSKRSGGSGRTPAERLSLFVRRVDKAVTRRAVQQQTVKASFSISGDAETMSGSFTTDTGDEDDMRSLLLDFRPFVSQSEDVFMPGILNVLEQQLTDDDFRGYARQIREHWNVAMRGQIGIDINGTKYTALNCFDLRVNGELFHDDLAKQAEFEALPPIMQGLVHQEMVSMVITCLRLLWAARGLIDEALLDGALPQLPGLTPRPGPETAQQDDP